MSDVLKIRHPFQEKDATQIACRIVEAYGGQIHWDRLMTLLYVVEREAWDKLEHPAVGGEYYFMEAGPIIGELQNEVRIGRFQIWSRHLSKRSRGDANEVCLIETAARDEISDALLEIIDAVNERTRLWNDQRLQEYCHNFGEYKQPAPGQRLSIAAEDILKAAGKSDEKIKQLQGESVLFAKLETALA